MANKEHVAVVVDLVSENDSECEKEDGNVDVEEPQPAGGKRKLALAKKELEPNRKKNPCPSKNNGVVLDTADEKKACLVRHVSPPLDDDGEEENDEDEEVVVLKTVPAEDKPETSAVAKKTYAIVAKLPPHIYLGDDGAIVTYGILPPLQKLQQQTSQTPKRFLLTNSTLLQHIQQKDGWSCGFRNIQMILTVLVPLLPSSHPFFEAIGHIYREVPEDLYLTINTDLLVLPSLTGLQNELEASWKEGFDPEGAIHFQHSVVGRPSRIGAVEVGFLFAYWWMDAHVVQFIKCVESRRLLPAFVFKYFQTAPQADERTASIVDQCLHWAEHNWDSDKTSTEIFGDAATIRSDSSILPLYLQWEGHSVTIIGIEPPLGNAATHRTNDWNQWNLLILCPAKCGMKFKNGGTSAFRKSCRTLGRTDCQVLVAGWNPLAYEERRARREKAAATTAAMESVVRAVE